MVHVNEVSLDYAIYMVGAAVWLSHQTIDKCAAATELFGAEVFGVQRDSSGRKGKGGRNIH